ncbi:hypothetical protein NPIL_375621 [Nephila pilipes]|uniref:Uncharacterized protein n=1 Tax=Nephila pilipes TaxID=299642 RepID=A0A8X6MVH4_NEPPI|nr:hypothetical protein NPIL_375621 [Nephila pilipes]
MLLTTTQLLLTISFFQTKNCRNFFSKSQNNFSTSTLCSEGKGHAIKQKREGGGVGDCGESEPAKSPSHWHSEGVLYIVACYGAFLPDGGWRGGFGEGDAPHPPLSRTGAIAA